MNGPTGFDTLQLKQELVEILSNQHITEPTSVQSQTIPELLAGKDVIAQSQTGTGKTLAYLLPIMNNLDVASKELQAMILVPTRELGMQILHEAELLSQGSGLVVQALIGGAATTRQLEKLRLHPQLIVGTPGKIIEFLKIKKLKMHRVKTIVVDEVDQVINLGSISELEFILKSSLRDRQIVFLSATMPSSVERLASQWMKEPVRIEVEPGQRTSASIEHLYFVCDEREKIDTLRRLVRLYNPKSAIVFFNETDDAAELLAKLKFAGLSVEALYGEAHKIERAVVLNGFREGKFQLLLATDVAARGLDIKGLTHIINFDLPIDAEHYVHRVGRTGRMGKAGTAISIATGKQQFIISKFEKSLGIVIELKVMFKGNAVRPEEDRSAETMRRAREARNAISHETNAREGKSRETGEKVELASAPDIKVLVPRRSVQQSTATPTVKLPETLKAKPKGDRHRDRKNKGAPKWLKDKKNKE